MAKVIFFFLMLSYMVIIFNIVVFFSSTIDGKIEKEERIENLIVFIRDIFLAIVIILLSIFFFSHVSCGEGGVQEIKCERKL